MIDRFRLTTVRILSIDGGGIRGIIPALVLLAVERRLHELNKDRPFHEYFDLIAGTSTGSLIALGLSVPGAGGTPMTPAKLVNLYRTEGEHIFPPAMSDPIPKLAHAVKRKYDSEYLESLLERIFGRASLEDALTDILVPSYDIRRRRPWMFRKRGLGRDRRSDPDFYVKDAARAATAAPTYFQPACIRPVDDDDEEYHLVDGAIYSNNPSLAAFSEARRIFPNAIGYTIVSLGTGVVDTPYTCEEVDAWGYIDWVAPYRGLPLFSMMMDGQSDTCIDALSHTPGVKLYRLDIDLDAQYSFMDDTRPETMSYLEKRAVTLVDTSTDLIEDLCRRL